jgi:hypothetical protein
VDGEARGVGHVVREGQRLPCLDVAAHQICQGFCPRRAVKLGTRVACEQLPCRAAGTFLAKADRGVPSGLREESSEARSRTGR